MVLRVHGMDEVGVRFPIGPPKFIYQRIIKKMRGTSRIVKIDNKITLWTQFIKE